MFDDCQGVETKLVAGASLTPAEESHLSTCPSCRGCRDLLAFRPAAGSTAEPSAALDQQLRFYAHARAAEPRPLPWRLLGQWALAAAAVLAVAGLVFLRPTPLVPDRRQVAAMTLDDADLQGVLGVMDTAEVNALTAADPVEDWQGNSLDQALLDLEIAVEFSQYCMSATSSDHDAL